MRYCELKHNQYWVWSSRLSSLDCMPQYKVNVDSANDALEDVCAIEQLSAQKKINIKKLANNRVIQQRYRNKIKNTDEPKERDLYFIKQEKLNKSIYEWAIKLNN